MMKQKLGFNFLLLKLCFNYNIANQVMYTINENFQDQGESYLSQVWGINQYQNVQFY